METIDFCRQANIVPFDSGAEERYQRLRTLRLSVGARDLRIAATALAQDLIVVTRNARDFGRIPGLKLEDWSIA